MLKTIPKSQLKLGMYIQDLNCDWMQHDFLHQSFMLRKQDDLDRLLAGRIDQVIIDTLKGLDVDGGDPGGSPGDPAPVRFEEELPAALRLRREATQVIQDLLKDVRLGRQIQMERLDPVVARIAGSILRNPGALVSLFRIREADTCTYQHSLSACALMILFARHLGMAPADLHQAGVGGLLHDVGKMRVPDHILNKPGRLTPTELAIMQDHVRLGLEALRATPGITPGVLQVAAEHHERPDGSGYPAGLKGDAISHLGRMASIVDVYDAITSIRIYHHGIEPAAALQQIFEASPGMFDEELVQRFIQAIGIYPVGSLVRLSGDLLAVVMEQNPGTLLRPRVRVVYAITEDRPLAPYDLDLAQAENSREAILNHEEPATWRLDTAALLTGDESR